VCYREKSIGTTTSSFFFFRLGIAKKAKGNNAPTKEFDARRVCVSYRHGIRMERKV
jgi:hypothetical protein